MARILQNDGTYREVPDAPSNEMDAVLASFDAVGDRWDAMSPSERTSELLTIASFIPAGGAAAMGLKVALPVMLKVGTKLPWRAAKASFNKLFGRAGSTKLLSKADKKVVETTSKEIKGAKQSFSKGREAAKKDADNLKEFQQADPASFVKNVNTGRVTARNTTTGRIMAQPKPTPTKNVMEMLGRASTHPKKIIGGLALGGLAASEILGRDEEVNGGVEALESTTIPQQQSIRGPLASEDVAPEYEGDPLASPSFFEPDTGRTSKNKGVITGPAPQAQETSALTEFLNSIPEFALSPETPLRPANVSLAQAGNVSGLSGAPRREYTQTSLPSFLKRTDAQTPRLLRRMF